MENKPNKKEALLLRKINAAGSGRCRDLKPPRRYAPQWFQIDSFGAEMLLRKNPCKKVSTNIDNFR